LNKAEARKGQKRRVEKTLARRKRQREKRRAQTGVTKIPIRRSELPRG